jgi:hypothetical protein
MIDTTKGPMPESALDKREGVFENDNERTPWVEYWLDGELVHRTATVNLKRGISIELIQGAFA